MRTILTAAAVAVFCCAQSASAVTVDFRNGLNGANGSYEDPVLNLGAGLSMTISAGVYAFDTIIDTDVDGFGNLRVSKTDAGLGVVLGFLPNLGPDLNAPDLLTFTFSRSVYFNSVLFGNVDSDDDFDLFVDGSLTLNEVGITGANPAALGGLEGTQFSFGADGLAVPDDFTIATIDVQPVPVPAGLALGLTGLAGLVGLRRRRTT